MPITGEQMAQKLKHQQAESNTQAQGAPAKNNVVAMPTRCTAEGCKKPVSLMTFCGEHYDWFKFGLINKNGQKPIDFDKKMQSYQKHHQKKAA
jgi:hypothetical protein